MEKSEMKMVEEMHAKRISVVEMRILGSDTSWSSQADKIDHTGGFCDV
jgi:hypothetical protein